MFMTVMTGHVAHENWNHLRSSFEKLCVKPPEGLVEIELVQGVDDVSEWNVITLWASKEAYELAVAGKHTAPCEQMFCDAGSVPHREHFQLVTRYQRV
jgi:heme-degrading monooxygenase HmoA